MCCKCHKRPAALGRKKCQQCLDYMADYQRKLRQKKTQEGMCQRCLCRPRVDGRLCAVGAAKHEKDLPKNAIRAKYMRAQRKARGLCSSCGQRPPAPGYKQCEICKQKRADKIQSFIEAGLCRSCGKKEPVPGLKYCIDCLEYYYSRERKPPSEEQKRRQAEQKKARRESFRAAGLCTRCGKRKPIEGKAECLECRTARAKRWHELHDKK